MYVRKFESDSLENALKDIKSELGPDAIILKTITNKGLKGAFKKNRIEITAAISEKNYTNKARVDMVLDDGQKGEFYAGSSNYISKMIDKHSDHDDRTNVSTSYGNIALNKNVSQSNRSAASSDVKSGLDQFLCHPKQEKSTPLTEPVIENKNSDFKMPEEVVEQNSYSSGQTQTAHSDESSSWESAKKIDALEKKLFELTKVIDKIDQREAQGIFQLRTSLKSLDIQERFIQNIIKKALFEFSKEELDDEEAVFDFALREMAEAVNVDMPLFSKTENSTPVITVLLSDISSGQTSIMMKLGALRKDCVLIKKTDDENEAKSLAEKLFGINVIRVKSISEIVSECRKAKEQGYSVIVDYKNSCVEQSEGKQFIDGLRRSFEQVEVLISLSAIHSEMYNRKVIGNYKSISDGLIVSHLDLCLNFGSLFNIAESNQDLPLTFFGTGSVIPDDVESATVERVLAGMFELDFK